MRTVMLLCAALALMWVLPLPSRSQGAAPTGENKPVTFVDLLGGKTFPLSLKVKELTGEWRRFTTSNMSSGMETFIMMAATEGRGMPGSTVFYTRGQTITLNTETFLIAYQQETKPFDLRQVMEENEFPAPESLTPDTTLNLVLLNLRNISNILDIKPFKLKDELAVNTERQAVLDRAREKDLRSQSACNLRQCILAVLMYAKGQNNTLPPLNDLNQLIADLPEYMKSNWKHPLTGELYIANAKIGGKPVDDFEKTQDVVVFYEGTNWSDGKRLIAFLDGHVLLLLEAYVNELIR